MQQPIFITGIGTGVGKTIISAIVTQALQANYWKPIQAGFDDGTDALQVKNLVLNSSSIFFDEVYKLQLPASPHIAAREENIKIEIDKIVEGYKKICQLTNQQSNNHQSFKKRIIIEGAGGLFVPINEHEFILDVIKALNAKVILVSRNYLGSINHSLLTAQVCKQNNIDVLGWIFNDQYMNYEEDIVAWSGYKKLASIPLATNINSNWVQEQASILKNNLLQIINN